jgi:S-adenosylmethionine-diacylglycerol 3-amino-3-carboxypropyl transferase
MGAQTGPLGSEILYSLCWEDLDVARAALRIRPGSTVLAIGAAGDNVLGLLLDGPARIIAVDLNPAQTALLELKGAAIGTLGQAAADFLTVNQPANWATYQRVRERLSPGAARFWDGHRRLVERGIIHVGRFERFVARFRDYVLPLVPGRAVVADMLRAADVEEQRHIYRERWNSALWRGVVRLAFSRRVLVALGRHRAFFAHAPSMDVGDHFLHRVEFGLTATPIWRNPYMTYALTGRHRLPNAAPDFLRPESAALIAQRLDRVEIRTEALIETLRALPDASVDSFYLSDVFELVGERDLPATLAEVARVGRPGARLCYWNNLVERSRPAGLANRITADDSMSAELAAHDRAFLYSRLVVEQILPVQSEVETRVA